MGSGARRVAADRRTAWGRDETEQRIRKKPVQYPAYPLEGCLVLTTLILKKGSIWLLEAQLYLQPRGMYRIKEWPDTCRADPEAQSFSMRQTPDRNAGNPLIGSRLSGLINRFGFASANPAAMIADSG